MIKLAFTPAVQRCYFEIELRMWMVSMHLTVAYGKPTNPLYMRSPPPPPPTPQPGFHYWAVLKLIYFKHWD